MNLIKKLLDVFVFSGYFPYIGTKNHKIPKIKLIKLVKIEMFFSKYTNQIDKKGRVSVPSCYRNTILSENNTGGIIFYPSVKHRCIEVSTLSRLNQVHSAIKELDLYSEERDAFEAIIFGESCCLHFDTEGRVIIPQYLLEYSQILDQVTFVGKGDVFELWNPEMCEEYITKSRVVANNNKILLKMIK